MLLFKTSAMQILAIFLAGLASVSLHAAERSKEIQDLGRIPIPTRVKPVDINSGSIEELKALPGMDDLNARRIVDGRPYQKRDDLVLRNIIPEEIFSKIKERIITVNAE